MANSSVVLVKFGKGILIADPGFDRTTLRKALEQEHIKTSDVTYVFLTHGHPDHS